MPGVAQVWLTANELHALVKVSTEKGTILSLRYRDSILPKLEAARNELGCPVPFRLPTDDQIPGQITVEEAINGWPPAEPLYGGHS